MTIPEILQSKNEKAKKALFVFDKKDDDEKVIFKFNIWSRYFFPKYFTSKDAPFHKELDGNNLKAYRGNTKSFVDIAFRGASKTARTKLFIAFVILNDLDHFRRYIKVLSADGTNSKQIVTDIYNMLIKCSLMYPEIFEKTDAKREETMSSFTTSTSIKVIADTVGTEQRGSIQEEARPDFILFEDFETRKTLRSAVMTKAIWDNMEEARTGLSKDGACVYNCNYISERGNVHKLVTKESESKVVLIIPIIKDGVLAWPDRYSLSDIEQMKKDDDDFEGERLCKPSASKDVMFDRESLDKMPAREPIKEIAGLKIFRKYDPSHRYASGHDVAGGVGLDSSTSVFMDFDIVPAQVVATYKNNTIKPDVFGYEIEKQSDKFGGCLTAVESNNHGHATIAIAKQNDLNLYAKEGKDTKIDDSEPKEYGWNTNGLTKPKMIYALVKAVEDGLIELNDKDLIQEAKSYTRDDLMDNEADPRLTTRHFDLLIGACICWQMKDHATVSKKKDFQKIMEQNEEEYNPTPFK